MEFHWWYVLAGLALYIVLFGKKKGGIVVEQFIAEMNVLDPRFEGCRPEAKYSTFKEGTPDHIDIEVEGLSISVGDQLEFCLNGELLAKVDVERDKEAKFDHWSDEGIDFPAIRAGDELVVRYQGVDVLQGTFQ